MCIRDRLGGALLILFFLSAAFSAPFWTRWAEQYGALQVLRISMLVSILSFFWDDGSRESNGYNDDTYLPENDALPLDEPRFTLLTTFNPNHWQPLAFGLVWGLSFATILTLFVTPAWLILPSRLKEIFSKFEMFSKKVNVQQQ